MGDSISLFAVERLKREQEQGAHFVVRGPTGVVGRSDPYAEDDAGRVAVGGAPETLKQVKIRPAATAFKVLIGPGRHVHG